jgi:NAD(P)-dependent dehydrogenase (short-subunit alcohol dehydrogenase family)
VTTQPTSARRLAGRVAIVTGGSRGLGAAIARAFAAEGAAVAVAARTEQVWNDALPGTVHETVRAIEDTGGTAIAVACDVMQEEDLLALVQRARSELGVVDLLVNNAALTAPGRPPAPVGSAPADPAASGTRAPREEVAPALAHTFLAMPVRGYRRHFDVGLFAAYRLMQLVVPGMVERGGGSIVNISSDAAVRPGEGPYAPGARGTPIAYGSNKAAIHHLTQSVALELAPFGITANVLMPSNAIVTPGLLATSGGHVAPDVLSDESFAEATIRLALETPETKTGWIEYSEDVLHPELGRRGWIGG